MQLGTQIIEDACRQRLTLSRGGCLWGYYLLDDLRQIMFARPLCRPHLSPVPVPHEAVKFETDFATAKPSTNNHMPTWCCDE